MLRRLKRRRMVQIIIAYIEFSYILLLLLRARKIAPTPALIAKIALASHLRRPLLTRVLGGTMVPPRGPPIMFL